MAWVLAMFTMFWVAVAWRNALFYPIDREKKSMAERGKCPIADFFYRVIRIVWCVLVAEWSAWLAIYWVICYALAWTFKKTIFYFYYDLD